MATFKNTSGVTINLGSVQVVADGTVTDSGFDYLGVLKWFYMRKYFSLVSGTEDYILSRPSTSPTLMQTVASWKGLNPLLSNNQKGIELDTGKYKYGDGIHVWRSLGYAGTDIVAVTAADPGSASIVAVEKLSTIETGADVTDAENIALSIYSAAAKTTVLPVDKMAILDTAASNALKNITLDQVVGTRKSVVTTQANFTSTTTLSTVTGLAQTGLLAGKVYEIKAKLFVDSTSNTGFKCAFAATDSLSATFFRCEAESVDDTGAQVAYTIGSAITDALVEDAGEVSVVNITGIISTSVGGTLSLKVAPYASHLDAVSILTGSTLSVTPIGG